MLPLTKRQREILDYLQDFIQQHGYAPSLEEIGRRFGLSSLATVHKHLTNLQEKGFIKRAWNRSRSVEMIPTNTAGRSVDLPLLGYVAAGVPIEAIATAETIAVPEDLVGRRDTYVLRVRLPAIGFDQDIRVVGVASLPAGFDGIACFPFVNRFTYGNFGDPTRFGLEA